MKITANTDGTYTIAPDEDEAAILQRAVKEYGPDTVKDLITNWIADRKRVFEQQDKDALKAKFDTLSPEEQAAILAKLGAV
jgi:hypothetical protein